jgi:fatty acid desaturase
MRALTAEELRRFYQPKPLRALGEIALDWAIVIAAAWSATWLAHPLASAVAIVVIASRQHALFAGVHEAAHFKLTANRRVSDLLASWLCAYPLLLDLHSWRHLHLLHHKHTNTPLDPDRRQGGAVNWNVAQGKLDFARLLALDFLHFIRRGLWDSVNRHVLHRSGDMPEPPARTVPRWLAQGMYTILILGVLLPLVGWKPLALYWFIPLFVVLPVLLRVRGVAEHMGPSHPFEYTNTRDIDCPRWERELFAPHNNHFHLTHHLYPRLPHYHIPAARELIFTAAERAAMARDDASFLRAPRAAWGFALRARETPVEP